MDQLVAAVERSPVVALFGPSGIGKTSLALALMHGPLAPDLPRAVYVSIAPGTGDEELTTALVRALGNATGLEMEIDWPALHESADARVEALLDLAEERGLRVVVDDLENANRAETEGLLNLLARYAKGSRWIALMLERPRDDERLFCLGLGALPDDVMARIATKVSSERPRGTVARAVSEAHGSPGALRLALFGDTRQKATPALPPDAEPLLRVLSILRVAVPLELLGSVIPLPSEPSMARLKRYGLLLQSPAGLLLHDVVRRQRRHAETLPERAALAKALIASPSPELFVEGMRLSLEAGDVASVAPTLESRLSALLAEGYGTSLWRLLEHREEPALESCRTRCAAHLGNPTALHRVTETGLSASGVTRARALYARGNLRALSEEPPAASAEIDEWLWFLRSQLLRGRPEEALETLRAADVDRNRDVRLYALWNRAEVLLGRPSADPIDVARALGTRSGVEEMEAVADVVESLRALGRSGEVLALIAATFPRLTTALRVERRLVLARAAASIDLGDVAGAAATLARLEPYTRSPSILRPPIVAQEVRLKLLRGEVDGLESRLDAARAEADGYDARTNAAELRALELDLALMTGTHPSIGALSAVRKPPGIEGDLLRVAVAETLARRGEPLGELATSAYAEAHALIARSCERLVSGDAEGALETALTASSRAVRISHLLHELRAEATVCAALSVLGRKTELAARAQKLVDVASANGCERWTQQGLLFSALAAPHVDYATLELLAATRKEPATGRLAQHLLGEGAPLDRYEEAVCGAPAATRPAVVGGGEPHWGMWRSRKLVWRPGTEHSFSRKRIGWALLTTLLDAGGEASKEALVLGAWDETEYHPIRHDARLQVAMRALREELEDDPGAPCHLLTTEAGYALGGTLHALP